MPDPEVLRWLNQGALVVMAAAFLWLVKVVINDIRHGIESLLARSEDADGSLARIEKTMEQVLDVLERIERNGLKG